MRLFSLMLSGWMLAGFGSEAAEVNLPAELRELPLTLSVTSHHYIHIKGEGRVEVPYPDALRLLTTEDLLTRIQEAYADLLPEGESPEFVIELKEPGSYQYRNRKKEETRIVEMLRRPHPETGMELVLFSAGERGFGAFRAITHVRVRADGEQEGHSLWSVEVYAYPENRFSRFFARNLGIADRYFRSKTEEISVLAREICLSILPAPAADGEIATAPFSRLPPDGRSDQSAAVPPGFPPAD
jgi:hypothetical protein